METECWIDSTSETLKSLTICWETILDIPPCMHVTFKDGRECFLRIDAASNMLADSIYIN